MIEINDKDIIDEITICLYCVTPASGLGCCGESSCHFEKQF